MSWQNLALWSAQIALLVTAGALLPVLFRLGHAHARLIFWQVLLAGCLVLPFVQPWEPTVTVVSSEAPAVAAAGPVVNIPAPAEVPRFGLTGALAATLAAGMLLRATWFGLGLLRLSRYRRSARELDPLPEPVRRIMRELGIYPRIRLSRDVAGPVTFGFHDPVILLPERFPELDPEVQAAVACHELLHVRRRDWLFTAAEEGVRIVFWFHPAVWWVLGQIQLAREQVVDREVVRFTEAREQYVDALLALSGAKHQLDLAPAPLFLRRRHLTARVAAIIKEVNMSRRRLYSSVAACFAVLLMAGWFVAGSLPLKAAPQVVADAPGVSVSGADNLIHRSAVAYPAEALKARVEGNVVVDAQLASDGTVADAAVVSGPMELRRAALESVLAWHFKRDAGSKVQVSIAFKLPEGEAAAPATKGVVSAVPATAAAPQGVIGGTLARRGPINVVGNIVLRKIVIEGLEPAAAEELRRRLPLREGQQLDSESMTQTARVMKEFDPHLGFSFAPADNAEAGGVTLRISPSPMTMPIGSPRVPTPFPPPAEGVQRIRVGGNVQQMKLAKKPAPVYPALAKEAGVQGVAQFNVLIGTDGKVTGIGAVSGHPLLIPAAMEALRQWEYAPTLLNGNPVEVVTQVDVNFTLAQ
ncbi:MAG TPA: TonB family protein [Bryobacteraceae bacterium]|nr:TonB family protein [Bryobacteraceae bacterium]